LPDADFRGTAPWNSPGASPLKHREPVPVFSARYDECLKVGYDPFGRAMSDEKRKFLSIAGVIESLVRQYRHGPHVSCLANLGARGKGPHRTIRKSPGSWRGSYASGSTCSPTGWATSQSLCRELQGHRVVQLPEPVRYRRDLQGGAKGFKHRMIQLLENCGAIPKDGLNAPILSLVEYEPCGIRAFRRRSRLRHARRQRGDVPGRPESSFSGRRRYRPDEIATRNARRGFLRGRRRPSLAIQKPRFGLARH
jgi:hypothetical protein